MPSRRSYRLWNPGQGYLVPPSPQEWLPDGDLAYFILDVIEVLDLSRIERKLHAKDWRGTRPYHPKMMVALLLYGYSLGVVSSRKIEQATYRDVGFRFLAGGEHPDHSVISEFRRRHLKALRGIFVQTVRLAQKAGLVSLGRVALDGTKVQANASKHKAMSYERMLKTERELRQEIVELLALAQQTDAREDQRFGRDKRGDEVPDELRRRESRLKKIQEAKAALEAEAASTRAERLEELASGQRASAEETDDPVERKRALTRAEKSAAEAKKLRDQNDDDLPPPSAGDSGLPHHRVAVTPEGKPKPKAQRNFTDPDSRIMKKGGDYLQGYNCQAAVDEVAQIIVGTAVTNQAPDQEHLVPVLERVNANCGDPPAQLLADNGYWSTANASYCEDHGIDAYIATGRLTHGERAPPPRGPPRPPNAKEVMRRKLQTTKGQQVYARRKVIPEPVFGQMKEARGLRRFLLRGLTKVSAEWDLWCATHNLLKLYRAGWVPA